MLGHGIVEIARLPAFLYRFRLSSLPYLRFRAEQALLLTIPMEEAPPDERMRLLAGVLSKWQGPCSVRFQLPASNGLSVLIDSGLAVTPSEPLMEELEALLPEAPLQFQYPNGAATSGFENNSWGLHPQTPGRGCEPLHP